jgi:SAM-dependent methyltransferase
MGEAIGSAAGGKGQDAGAVYALGSSQGESARLQRQAEELAADSAALLDRVGLRPGQSAIDLGCGPRGVLDLLAERVAPAGRVVGLDSDPAHAAMATWFAAGRGLGGVEVVTADARSTGLPSGSFDLVTARTLLVNLPEPGEVAAEMMRLARPGGWVASLEPDTEHALCYPPHPAFDRLQDIFTVAFRRNGADRGSAAGYRSLSAGRAWNMSRWRPGRRCTRMATPGGPSAWTWCKACARRCWRWAWPPTRNLTSWTRRPALTSMTPIRS